MNNIAEPVTVDFSLDLTSVPTPTYTCQRAVRKLSTDTWRPALKPHEILALQPFFAVQFGYEDNPLPEGVDLFTYSARRDTVYQIGRAYAQLKYWQLVGRNDNGGMTIRHKHEDRAIFVGRDGDRAIVHESRKTKNGAWVTREHPLSQREAHGLQVAVLQVADAHRGLPGVWLVYGNTYYHKDALKSAGGQFSRARVNGVPVKGWKYVGELPDEVIALAQKSQDNARKFNDAGPRWTKYHFIAKLLDGKVPFGLLDTGEYESISEARTDAGDAYIRETWRIAGYDWQDFPRRETAQ